MKKYFFLVFTTLLFSVITGCYTQTGHQNTSEDENEAAFDENSYQQIITAHNDLAFRLFSETAKDNKENTLISPTSLFTALSMLYNSADGETKREVAKALAIEGLNTESLSQANASLIASLNNHSADVRLNIANSIWLNDRFHFKDDFVKASNDYFYAKAEEINIGDGTAPYKINDWVKKQTNSKIDKVADSSLDDDLVAMLINAIYFSGKWTYPFDENETEDRVFYLSDDDKTDVPFMKLTEVLGYLENENFQAISLPYGDEREMSMKIFLPKKKGGLQDFEKTLTSQDWDVWDSEFQAREGTILLPRFQIEYEKTLNKALKQLGMVSAFDENANFSEMIEENDPLWISQMKQKTFLEVNEKGSEASAATSAEIETTSAPIPEEKPFTMEVNQPFFIAVTDDETDAILFMGTIHSP